VLCGNARVASSQGFARSNLISSAAAA
jgi:hypothetical protein